MTDLKPEDLVKRASDLMRAVERFIREENAHAKRIVTHRNRGGESAHDDEAPTSRDAVDLAHADLMSDFTAADCKLALSLLADRARMEKALRETNDALLNAAAALEQLQESSENGAESIKTIGTADPGVTVHMFRLLADSARRAAKYAREGASQ